MVRKLGNGGKGWALYVVCWVCNLPGGGGLLPPDLWTLHGIDTCLVSVLFWVPDWCVYHLDKHAWVLSSWSANGEKIGEWGKGWALYVVCVGL